ncbi:MAG: autotransporter domain-containing protein [Candidatus Omnitrophica bacterium]|nr:autotransporter domain-containing protein [Candidatus Omnitrophota bacterium]
MKKFLSLFIILSSIFLIPTISRAVDINAGETKTWASDPGTFGLTYTDIFSTDATGIYQTDNGANEVKSIIEIDIANPGVIAELDANNTGSLIIGNIGSAAQGLTLLDYSGVITASAPTTLRLQGDEYIDKIDFGAYNGNLILADSTNLTLGDGSTGTGIFVNGDHVGTLTLNGNNTINGVVGSKATSNTRINNINVGIGNTSTSTLNSNVYANNLNFSDVGEVRLTGDSDILTVAFGSNNGKLSMGDDTTLEVSSITANNVGTLKLEGSTDVIGEIGIATTARSGTIGLGTTARLDTIEAGANGSNSNFNVNIYASNLDFTGDGQITLKYAAGRVNDITTVDFGTHDGILTLEDGVNLTGAITTTNDIGTHGTLELLGSSIISGTVGSDGNRLATVDAQGAAGKEVIFEDDLFVKALNINSTGSVELQGATNGSVASPTNVSLNAAGKFILGTGANLTGDVAFGVNNGEFRLADGANMTGNISATNTGTLTLLGNSTIDGTVGANAGHRIGTISAQVGVGSTATFVHAVNASNLNFTGASGAGEGVVKLQESSNISNVAFGSHNGTLILDNGANLTTGGITANNTGNITVQNGSSVIDGNVGVADTAHYVGTINVNGGATAEFEQLVYAHNLNVSGGSVARLTFDSNITTVDLSDNLSNNLELTDEVNFTGTIIGNNTGDVVFLGDGSATGNIGISGSAVNTLYCGQGTVTIDGDINAQNVEFEDNNELRIASGHNIHSMVTTANDGTGTLTFLGATSTGGDMGDAVKELAAVNFNGATALNNDIYASVTNIKAGSTVTLSGNHTINGDLSLAADPTAVLDVGAHTFSLGIGTTAAGVYTQAAGSKLKVTIDSVSTSGKVESVAAAVVSGTSIVDVNVAAYVPNNARFTIIDGNGGSGVNIPTLTYNSSRATFSLSSSGGDLILTASRMANGFGSLGSNANARAAGAALDNVTNPTSDMANVLTTLDGLSDDQVTAALDTVYPAVDGGALNVSRTSLRNFINTSFERIQRVELALNDERKKAKLSTADIINRELDAIEASLNKIQSNIDSGLSSGDCEKSGRAWGKTYGSYLNQKRLHGIDGYKAWNGGTAIGEEMQVTDSIMFGGSGGYAMGQVNSEVNEGRTDIQSAQGSLYAGYHNVEVPFFIDGVGAFAWNWYDGRRDINIGGINRIAKAQYDGQQYDGTLRTGYTFNIMSSLEFTPLASLQYSHTRIAGYTETDAGGLNLKVDPQNYDNLQSGLGASISFPMRGLSWGNFIPEFHGTWLKDIINDNLKITSRYTGGGGPFVVNGSDKDKTSYNLGGQLAFDFKNDLSIVVTGDTEIEDEFLGIYGSGKLLYKFW